MAGIKPGSVCVDAMDHSWFQDGAELESPNKLRVQQVQDRASGRHPSLG
jgi:hypothetical protein